MTALVHALTNTRRLVSRAEMALPFPPSVNSLWTPTGTGGVRRSSRYASWIRTAGTTLLIQRPGRIAGPYSLHVILSRRRRVDMDNTVKALSDLLETHGVIENDRLCNRLTVEWAEDIDDCRVTVEAWQVAA